MIRKLQAAAGVIAAVILGAAGQAAADATVKLNDDSFAPANVTVSAGDEVTFEWVVGLHNVTFSDGETSGAPIATPGTTWSRTLTEPGKYPFVCEVHESLGMTGTVTVVAAAGGGDDGGADPEPTGYPYTGPESALLPGLGGLLLLSGAAWRIARRRR